MRDLVRPVIIALIDRSQGVVLARNHVYRWPLEACTSGAICQSFSSRFIHRLVLLSAPVATSEALKLWRVSNTHGPQSAWRLNGCELLEAANAPKMGVGKAIGVGVV